MKPYCVRFWHGAPPFSFKDGVEKITRKQGDGTLFFDGSLDQWQEAWRKPFLFYPAVESDAPYIAGTIWITPHGSFGQR